MVLRLRFVICIYIRCAVLFTHLKVTIAVLFYASGSRD